MKDAIDVTLDVRNLLNIPAVTGLLTGSIWQTEKPTGRQTISDIVVNCSSVTNNQDQVARVNVAVYWPNLSSGLADQANLRRVGKIVTSYLDTQWKDAFHCYVEDGGVIVKDSDGSNFYNIRVVYRALQNNYQNI
jgi:hypothetical protein